MRYFNLLARRAAALSVISVLTLAAGCSKSTDTSSTAGAASTATSSTSSAPQAKTESKLGDLSAFRGIAADVAALVNKGDLPAARTRIKDLEVAWDSAEAGLKPRAADDWHKLDKAIDTALKALRADVPNQNESQNAITNLLQIVDGFNPAVKVSLAATSDKNTSDPIDCRKLTCYV